MTHDGLTLSLRGAYEGSYQPEPSDVVWYDLRTGAKVPADPPWLN